MSTLGSRDELIFYTGRAALTGMLGLADLDKEEQMAASQLQLFHMSVANLAGTFSHLSLF